MRPMKCRLAVQLLRATTLALSLSACAADEYPNPQKIGVFADTDSGLIELTVRGQFDRHPLSERYRITLPSRRGVPTVDEVHAFFVNMPNALITESRVYYLPNLRASWGIQRSASDPTPARIDLLRIEEDVFKIVLKEKPPAGVRYVALFLTMPMGVEDRFYPVQIRLSASEKVRIQALAVECNDGFGVAGGTQAIMAICEEAADGNAWMALENLGIAHVQCMARPQYCDLELGLQYFHRALDVDDANQGGPPNWTITYRWLSNIYEREGRLEEAIAVQEEHLHRAKSADPTDLWGDDDQADFLTALYIEGIETKLKEFREQLEH